VQDLFFAMTALSDGGPLQWRTFAMAALRDGAPLPFYHRNKTVINFQNHWIGHNVKVNVDSFSTHEELSYDTPHAYVLVICVGFKKISNGRFVIS